CNCRTPRNEVASVGVCFARRKRKRAGLSSPPGGIAGWTMERSTKNSSTAVLIISCCRLTSRFCPGCGATFGDAEALHRERDERTAGLSLHGRAGVRVRGDLVRSGCTPSKLTHGAFLQRDAAHRRHGGATGSDSAGSRADAARAGPSRASPLAHRLHATARHAHPLRFALHWAHSGAIRFARLP